MSWQHPAFADLYGRPFSAANFVAQDDTSTAAAVDRLLHRKLKIPLLTKALSGNFHHGKSSSSATTNTSSTIGLVGQTPQTFQGLASAMEFVLAALPIDDPAANMLQEASQLANSMAHLASPSPAQPGDASKLVGFIEGVVSRVSRTRHK